MNKHLPYLNSIVFRFRVISVCLGFSWFLLNVYYEVGHAHARGKRVILYRQSGTRVHFDISHRNCPEYQNISDLKQQLRKRMENVTNKPRKA